MEDENSTRPSIGFPLGLALLLFMLISMSAFFTCCLHWDKLRSLLGYSPSSSHHLQPDKPTPPLKKAKRNIEGESLPVLMPGDQVPKFIAISCPCQPPVDIDDKMPAEERIFPVIVQKPPPFPLPLYQFNYS